MGRSQQEVPSSPPSTSREGKAGEGTFLYHMILNITNKQPRTEEQKEASNKRVKANEGKRRQKIKEAGIDYEFEGHA
jgi:hypothetical protein